MAIEQRDLPAGVSLTDTRLGAGTLLHRAQRYTNADRDPPITTGVVWLRRYAYPERRMGKETEIYGSIVGVREADDENLVGMPAFYVYLPAEK